MKLQSTNRKSTSGSVLPTTMVITFVIGATLASFLLLTQHQTFSNARSQSWNNSLAVAEAGVEDALQMINKYKHDEARLMNWSVDAANSADGWHPSGPDSFQTFRWLGNDYRAAYYVIINNADPAAPTITSRGYLRYDYEYKHVPVGTAAAGTTFGGFQSRFLTREIHVVAVNQALNSQAMLAKGLVDFKGNNIATDSFDSSDPTMSYWAPGATYGIYDATYRGDKGDVASNADVTDTVQAGNANIMGHVRTGPGGSVAVGASGSIGSVAWVSGGNNGVEAGWTSDDMNVKIDNVDLPQTTWLPLPVEGGQGLLVGGKNYKHVLTASGDYMASTFSGSVYVAPGVDARVHLTDDVNLAGQDEIRIDPQAQKLTLYMGGNKFSNSGLINETGNAMAFNYFGLSNNKILNMGGNSVLVGAIYAPEAVFTVSGGGNNTYDFIGSIVAKTITMNGHYNFHFDEALLAGAGRGFIPTSWQEN